MIQTPFSRIISGEEKSFKIAEDEYHIAILDKKPVKKGHVIVIPKKPVDFIYDLADDELCRLHLFAGRIAHALKKAVPCKKVGVAVIGLEVPHAHIHLVPLDAVAELNFSRERVAFTEDESASLVNLIQSFLK